jgi:hypothetical protein
MHAPLSAFHRRQRRRPHAFLFGDIRPSSIDVRQDQHMICCRHTGSHAQADTRPGDERPPSPMTHVVSSPGTNCRSGFTTLPLTPLPESSPLWFFFLELAQMAHGVGYEGIRWTRGFTWFEPPECNTLRPRVNGVVLLCLSVRLKSLSSALGVCSDLL